MEGRLGIWNLHVHTAIFKIDNWNLASGPGVKNPPANAGFSSVAQLCPTLCDPMNRSMPGLPVHHQLPEFTQTHVHRVGDANAGYMSSIPGLGRFSHGME